MSSKYSQATFENSIGLNTPDPVAMQMQAPARKADYTIRNGDTLSQIAQRNKISLADLKLWNNIQDADKIKAGANLSFNAPPTAQPVGLPNYLAMPDNAPQLTLPFVMPKGRPSGIYSR